MKLTKDIKYRIWNKRILLWWYRLWIRQDEFHKSLSIDPLAIAVMTHKERNHYISDLLKRRAIAHERDLATC